MIYFFLLLVVIEILLLSYLYIKKTKKVFNHITAINFGMFFYMILPIIIGETGILRKNESLFEFYNIFNTINFNSKLLYLIFIAVLVLVSYIASIKTKRSKTLKKEKNKISTKFNHKRFIIIGYILTFISLIYLIINHDVFFKGYTIEYSGVINRGSFAALSLVYLAYYLIYLSYEDRKHYNFIVFSTVLFLLNILLLSLGTRMYVISTILCLLIYFEAEFNYLKHIKYIAPIIVISIVIVTFIGAIRSGFENFSLELMIINSLLEFLYTSISLLTFLSNSIRDLINFPIILLSYLVNLVPSFLMENKLDFVIQLSSTSYPIYSPGGALNLYVDLIVNFGILCSIIFFYFSSKGLTMLSEYSNSKIKRIIYSLITSFLFFSFFRDGFTSSLIKNILEFSIIIPLALYLICSSKET